MGLFRNLRVTAQMLLVGAIPGLVAAAFAAQTLLAEYTARQATATLARQVALIAELSYTAHELQRERGASVGFLADGGEAFAEDLGYQREDTDVEVANLADQRGRIDRATAAPAFVARVDAAMAALEGLDAQRRAIDAGTAAAPAVKAFYTGIIDDIIASVGVLAGLSGEPAIAQALTS